jgi:hypothetical protein
MEYSGTARSATYCLPTTQGSCSGRDYDTPVMRTSVDGVAATYCTFDESLKTCEAHLDGVNAKSCSSDSDCGDPLLSDAKCEYNTISGASYCTGFCADDFDCWSYPYSPVCGTNGHCVQNP